jgi:hypothetical protein
VTAAAEAHENALAAGHGEGEVGYLLNEDERLARLRREKLLDRLVSDHFVVTVQLNLDVSDTEGFTPSFAITRPLPGKSSPNRVTSLGASITSTQERAGNVNYSVDLASLNKNPPACAPADGVGGVAGKLGLVDIVYDGLTSLQKASKNNIYSAGTGPVVPPLVKQVQFEERVTIPAATASGSPLYRMGLLTGVLTLGPGATGGPAPGSAAFIGDLVLDKKCPDDTFTNCSDLTPERYVAASLSGPYFASTSVSDPSKFTLSGSMTFDDQENADAKADLGYSATVTFNGIRKAGELAPASSARRRIVNTVSLNGFSPQGSGGTSAATFRACGAYTTPAVDIHGAIGVDNPPAQACTPSNGAMPRTLAQPESVKPLESNTSYTQIQAFTGSTKPSGTGSPGGGGGSAASFGTVVTFTLAYSGNANLVATLAHFKGPGGAASLGSAGRTNTDQMTISFTPACQDHPNDTVEDYWDTIPLCFDLPGQTADAITANFNAIISRALVAGFVKQQQ